MQSELSLIQNTCFTKSWSPKIIATVQVPFGIGTMTPLINSLNESSGIWEYIAPGWVTRHGSSSIPLKHWPNNLKFSMKRWVNLLRCYLGGKYMSDMLFLPFLYLALTYNGIMIQWRNLHDQINVTCMSYINTKHACVVLSHKYFSSAIYLHFIWNARNISRNIRIIFSMATVHWLILVLHTYWESNEFEKIWNFITADCTN